ncbi:MAG: EscU/YscU/HrcU family type III secretion system export apparatus switch protein [Rhodobacterales bacterium]|jgi:flagellar biosynthetic protein FlhB
MAESDGGQDKTEEPTQKKLEKAAEDGQIASSKELFVFTTLAVGFLLYYVILFIVPRLLVEWSSLFRFERGAFLIDEMVRLSWDAFYFVFVNSVLFAVPMFIVVLATQGAMNGKINFAPGAMAFKGSKINPLAGLKRMFSSKALVELLKGIFKVAVLLPAGGYVIYRGLPTMITSEGATLWNAMTRMHDTFFAMMVAFLLILGLLSLVDVLWQNHTHREQMKMTLQEVKDESKETEGNPEVKAKIRRMQMTVAARAVKQREALSDVPDATAIITNPTHFAVALKYEVGTLGAPRILAMGRGLMAAEIIERGTDAGITIFRNPLLARALFFAGEIGDEIPEQLFSAVAAVLAFIYRLNNGEELDPPDLDVPDDMQFDEFGRPLSAAV